jgi:hypothetical protein
MADTNPYIVAAPDGTLPNSRNLTASGGLFTSDSGAEGQFNIFTGGNLAALNTFSTGGYLVYSTTANNFVPRTLIEGTGITITDGDGGLGNTTISVEDGTTVQQVNVQSNSVSPIYTGTTLNFVGAGGTATTVGLNGNVIDVTITSSGSEAPGTATYILQTPNGSLPDAQALSALATGILKSTTSTGVVSIASPTADYLPYSAELASIATITPTLGTFIAGNGAGGFSAFLPSVAVGNILVSSGTAALPEWLPSGLDNYVLTSNGPGTLPSWRASAAVDDSAIVLPGSTTAVDPVDGNVSYIPTNTSTLVTFTLPTSPTPGNFYEIIGFGSAGWRVYQNSGQTITVGYSNGSILNTTTGPSGYLSSVLATDSVIIYCISSTQFVAQVQTGQLTVI